MSDLYANSPRAALVAKRETLIATLRNLDRIQHYAFNALHGDEQIALTDAMLTVSADLRDIRAAIGEIDRTIPPLVPEIDVFVLADVR
jgi:hypothetical protein